MTQQPIQPEVTKVTAKHTINYSGLVVTIKGKHECKFATKSKMDFSFWVDAEQRGASFGTKSTLSFKGKLDFLVKSINDAKAYRAKSDAFRNMYESLSTAEKISHSNFAYARFQNSTLGNYYTIYWKSQLSPSGVESVGGCSETEWEIISKATGNSHNYYSPTENKMTAR